MVEKWFAWIFVPLQRILSYGSVSQMPDNMPWCCLGTAACEEYAISCHVTSHIYLFVKKIYCLLCAYLSTCCTRDKVFQFQLSWGLLLLHKGVSPCKQTPLFLGSSCLSWKCPTNQGKSLLQLKNIWILQDCCGPAAGLRVCSKRSRTATLFKYTLKLENWLHWVNNVA